MSNSDRRCYLYHRFDPGPWERSGGPYNRLEAQAVAVQQGKAEDRHYKDTGRHFEFRIIEMAAGLEAPSTIDRAAPVSRHLSNN